MPTKPPPTAEPTARGPQRGQEPPLRGPAPRPRPPCPPTPPRRRFTLANASDRRRLEGAMELARLHREDQADLRRDVVRWLRPLADVPLPAVRVAHLGAVDLGQFSLGTGTHDAPTVTLAARMVEGRGLWFADARRDRAGWSRFTQDLLLHELGHVVAFHRAESGEGPPLTSAKHGWAFVRACAALCVAHRRGFTKRRVPLGSVPPAASRCISTWPISQRPQGYYGAAVSPRFLASVAARREPLA